MKIKKYLLASEQPPRIFRTDETGRILFYPWSYPGQGFYINEEQKKKITFFIFMIMFSIFLFVTATHILVHYQIINLNVAACIYLAVWVTFPAWYSYQMYSLTKKLEFYIAEKKTMPRIFYILLFFLFSQILGVATGIYAAQTDPSVIILVFICGLYALILLGFLIQAFRTKGYFLSK